ncbi:MAG: hypothetical protein C0406_00955 [Sideroxydans sp.]|nr:hypothetical protein [Sideroxydans sp.]
MVILVEVLEEIVAFVLALLGSGPKKYTCETDVRFVPVIVIVIGVPTVPVFGVKLVMVGVDPPPAGGT